MCYKTSFSGNKIKNNNIFTSIANFVSGKQWRTQLINNALNNITAQMKFHTTVPQTKGEN
jgi:hypothetical protein